MLRTSLSGMVTAVLAVLVGGLMSPAAAEADGAIDFSTVPGGTPGGGLAINSQYESAFGVTFALADGTSPTLAKVGGTNGRALGFVYGTGRWPDTPAPGQAVGDYFLTANGLHAGSHDLVMTFTNPVAAVSGDVLDIDHADQWTVLAKSADGSILGRQFLALGSPDTGDGVATPFGLTFSSNEVASLDLIYSGTAPRGVRLDELRVHVRPERQAAPPLRRPAAVGGVGGRVAARCDGRVAEATPRENGVSSEN